MAGSDFIVDLEEDEDLVIPDYLQGRVEVRRVQWGFDRTAFLTALDNVYLDPADLVTNPERKAFDAYRADLKEFYDYRAEIAEGLE